MNADAFKQGTSGCRVMKGDGYSHQMRHWALVSGWLNVSRPTCLHGDKKSGTAEDVFMD